MPLGVITRSGRILTAKLLRGEPVEGITHCAIGDGNATFSDPLHPPAPSVEQTGLIHECARKRFYKRSFLEEHQDGALLVNGTRYIETPTETRTIGVFFRFEEAEANGITIKEYGFFGGDVAYVADNQTDFAVDGRYHEITNPTGQVLQWGYLYEVKNIPDFNKTNDTRVEFVGVFRY
ncbi:hypothetical protein SCOR_32785 [Sulfidibacter corallicola]|uniref:Uncharacterized protein n=1 Tax=Sulfidibacter corallicola TaxID=2818388 RepID=A0A8A4TKM5_SULCO|nr:phage tail protein [Sulfidibacter corallicola]QTD49682.1 hypothetical protein J3U87_29210 [Sulfidibacter corallicola]